MKRNMDLVRDLLLAIEDGLQMIDLTEGLPGKEYKPEEVEYHYGIMVEHGLIAQQALSIGGAAYVKGMTWEGHDFIDTVRDPKIWKKTKEAATTVGGVGFKAMLEIGKALAKQELQKLGIPLP